MFAASAAFNTDYKKHMRFQDKNNGNGKKVSTTKIPAFVTERISIFLILGNYLTSDFSVVASEASSRRFSLVILLIINFSFCFGHVFEILYYICIQWGRRGCLTYLHRGYSVWLGRPPFFI